MFQDISIFYGEQFLNSRIMTVTIYEDTELWNSNILTIEHRLSGIYGYLVFIGWNSGYCELLELLILDLLKSDM